MALTFTPTVGVAPGTTTMTLGRPSGELVCLGGPCEPTFYDPYATESQLRSGLRGLGEARVGVGVVAAALAFAAVLGFGFWKRRK